MRPLILRIITIVLFIVGTGQLALSQVHILASTKIFANEIGLYLFLFIIFGLTTGFNAVLIERLRSVISFVVSGVIASVSGFVYIRLLQADVLKQEALTMADVSDSWQLVMVAIGVYLVGVVVVPLLSWPDVKNASSYA